MTKTIIAAVLLPFCILLVCACEPTERGPVPAADAFADHFSQYGPAKIRIIPLTRFASPDPERDPELKIYVDLLDDFGSHLKSPGVFRFELYEYLPRSAEPKGKRLFIWPDVDLTDPVVNNARWRDFLRSYEFVLELDFEPRKNSKFVLQANCLCPAGKRLTSDFVVEYIVGHKNAQKKD